jgi:hypothetical protein
MIKLQKTYPIGKNVSLEGLSALLQEVRADFIFEGYEENLKIINFDSEELVFEGEAKTKEEENKEKFERMKEVLKQPNLPITKTVRICDPHNFSLNNYKKVLDEAESFFQNNNCSENIYFRREGDSFYLESIVKLSDESRLYDAGFGYKEYLKFKSGDFS